MDLKKVTKLLEDVQIEEHTRQGLYTEVFLFQTYAWTTILTEVIVPFAFKLLLLIYSIRVIDLYISH
jgi:hypothetical protein